MTKTVHSIYIGTMTLIVIGVTVFLAANGYEYYQTPLEERYYLPTHSWFKPSGIYGHGLGILGTLMIAFGVGIYIARKRYNFMEKYLRLKYLLEFHIFLCILGPILILFHTAFKFGGIVSVAFWSMVLVVLSGVIGRYIYLQIPRTIKGRELSLNEVVEMKENLSQSILTNENLNEDVTQLIEEITHIQTKEGSSYFAMYFRDRENIRKVRKKLKEHHISGEHASSILSNLKEEMSLSHKISRLQTMQRLFKYWHVAHLPFALIMLIILIIHVGVTLLFGYKWIF
jgi:hypothetical protein